MDPQAAVSLRSTDTDAGSHKTRRCCDPSQPNDDVAALLRGSGLPSPFSPPSRGLTPWCSLAGMLRRAVAAGSDAGTADGRCFDAAVSKSCCVFLKEGIGHLGSPRHQCLGESRMMRYIGEASRRHVRNRHRRTLPRPSLHTDNDGVFTVTDSDRRVRQGPTLPR